MPPSKSTAQQSGKAGALGQGGAGARQWGGVKSGGSKFAPAAGTPSPGKAWVSSLQPGVRASAMAKRKPIKGSPLV